MDAPAILRATSLSFVASSSPQDLRDKTAALVAERESFARAILNYVTATPVCKQTAVDTHV